MRLALAAATLMIVSPVEAEAPRCMARFVQDAHSRFNPEKVEFRGRVFGPISQLHVDRKTRSPYFCSEDIGCYSASAIEIISPCRFISSEYKDEEEDHIDMR